MTSRADFGRILAKKDGFACCPRCGKKILRILPETSARSLSAWCRSCGKYYIVNIDSGQCYLSACPISPDGE